MITSLVLGVVVAVVYNLHITKVREGLTTLEEALRVARSEG